MSDLLHLQNKFQNYLLKDDADIKKLIVSSEKVSADTRLAIYSNSYRLRLIEALVSNYPVLHVYVGEEMFNHIANDYITAHPSQYRSIRWFGDKLGAFLNDHEVYKTSPYLAELAQFEWLQTMVFDAANSQILKMTDITQIPADAWMNMRIYPHPSVYRINVSWNIVQIWQAITDEKPPDEPTQSRTKVPWLLWRSDLLNHFCSLAEEEAWAIDAILQNQTFGEICVGLCQWVNEEKAGVHAAALLKGWIQSGLLAKVTW